MEGRKVTFKLYPKVAETERLTAWVRLHCERYNAALQERIEAYRKVGKSISYYDQQNVLPEIKAARPEFVELGSHALQQTLRRLDLAFQAFFRRVKAGQTPGFPRFKASKRFPGFCYPDPAGWKLYQQGQRVGTLRLGSGKDAMAIRLRGQHRFGADAKPNDLTIIRKNSEWFASVTLRVPITACARERTDHRHRGIDFGLTDWATFDNGQTLENPRWTRNELYKPSQRCAKCWEIVSKTLAKRVHECPHCGHTAPRDQNSASVVLIDAHTPGTGVAARPKPLPAARSRKSKSVTRETPATTTQGGRVHHRQTQTKTLRRH